MCTSYCQSFLTLVWIAFWALGGCAGGEDAGAINTGTVIVGVTSDFTPGVDIARLRTVMRADGLVLRDETLKAAGGDRPLSLPVELRFGDVAGGTKIDATMEAFKTYYSDEAPLVARAASTHVVSGRTLLLRARIEQECIPSFRLTGDLIAPTCDSPKTCIAAACADPYVPPSVLEDYAPTWAEEFEDACKPLSPGEPVVVIGEGRTGFKALAPHDVVQAEAGPQGGYHIWISIRMRNLHQTGSKTVLNLYRQDSGEPLGTFVSAQSYDPVEGDGCELVGVRCQLTLQSSSDVAMILGQELRVTATVADVTGDVGAAEQIVTVSENVVKEQP